MPQTRPNRVLDLFGDEGADIKWMTYGELSQVRGISVASARGLVYRRRWRRQAGNDGTMRAAVPVDEVTAQTGIAQSSRDDFTQLVSSLESALSVLRAQLERERSRADQAMEAAERNAALLAASQAQVVELQAARNLSAVVRVSLERALTAEESARAQAEASLETAQLALANAEAASANLRQVEQIRQARGRLLRLKAAWHRE
jgi:hypothetical protein